MTKRLNLLPKEAGGRNKLAGSSLGRRRQLLLGGCLMFLALAAWRSPAAIHQLRSFASHRQEIEELKRLKATLQAQTQTAEEQLASDRSALKLRQAEFEIKRKSLARAQRPLMPLSGMLSELAKQIPDQVWVTKLAYSSRMLTISGASDDASAATRLMDSLERSGSFLQTTFGYARRASNEKESSNNKSHAFLFEITTVPVLGLEIRDSAQ